MAFFWYWSFLKSRYGFAAVSRATMMACDDAGVSRVICRPWRLFSFVKASYGFARVYIRYWIFLKPSCGIAADDVLRARENDVFHAPRFAKIRRILKIPKTAVLCRVIWHDKLDMTPWI
jgi:hypothetical protein